MSVAVRHVHPTNGSHECYGDDSCGYSWHEDGSREDLYIAMICMWVLTGVLLICAVIACGVSGAALGNAQAKDIAPGSDHRDVDI